MLKVVLKFSSKLNFKPWDPNTTLALRGTTRATSIMLKHLAHRIVYSVKGRENDKQTPHEELNSYTFI